MIHNECWAVILAAGRGERLAQATGGEAKQFVRWRDAPLWWASVKALAASPVVHGVVLVFPADEVKRAEAELAEHVSREGLGVPWKAVSGGPRRQDSVRLGLEAVPASAVMVLVHDAARPFVTPALASRLVAVLLDAPDSEGAGGAVPALAVTDTIKVVRGDLVESTPDRATLRAVQTPQAFRLPVLRGAHARAFAEGWDVTDDASLLERCGIAVIVTEGEACNIKITRPEDLSLLNGRTDSRLTPCMGWGYDVHRFGGNRPLVLGGVPIPGDLTVEAHSDGDVLLHALMDALLGSMGGGDIGHLFPDSDPRWANASSAVMLDEVTGRAARAGLCVTHVDLTVIAQKPRIAPHVEAIRRNVARLLALPEDSVNVKATTEEGLGFTGEGKGLKAVAMVSAFKNSAGLRSA